jgi:hypothetical protein
MTATVIRRHAAIRPECDTRLTILHVLSSFSLWIIPMRLDIRRHVDGRRGQVANGQDNLDMRIR